MGRAKVRTERDFQEAFAALARKSARSDIAVAYCGKDGYQIFPERPGERPESIRMLVDASTSAVSRGLTNPAGLERLLYLGELRSLERLHAKVYIFDDVAIVGSINLSENSLEQYQCAVEVRDDKAVRGLRRWFEKHWAKAIVIDEKRVRKLIAHWPGKAAGVGKKSRLRPGRLRRWKAPLEKTIGPADFTMTLPDLILRRAIKRAKSNRCPYAGDENLSCYDMCRRSERTYRLESKNLRRLLRRIDAWNRYDLEELFRLAFLNGRAAKIRKPQFLRQGVARIRKAVDYLYNGSGDPYRRFENVAAKDGPYHLDGVGAGGVAMLMHLWKPSEFPVYNKPVAKGLKKLKVSFGRAFSKNLGQGYKDRSEAIKFLSKKTGLKSLSAVDHFIDGLGKGHFRVPRS